MKRKIETEITFAEMVQGLIDTNGTVKSPVNIFDSNTLVSIESYDQALKIISAISSLKRGESIDFSESNGHRPRLTASISIESLWFSMPIAINSQDEMHKAFFENTAVRVWLGTGECSVKTKSYGGNIDKLPEMDFCIGNNRVEIGMMKDNEGYSLYVSKSLENPSKNPKIFTPLSEVRKLMKMIEKIMSTDGKLPFDSTRDGPEKRSQKIERVDMLINFHLDNNQKTKIGGLCLKKGETFMVF